MQLWLGRHRHPGEDGFAELGAGRRDDEAPSLQVANGQTRRKGVHKVPGSPSAVGQDRRLVLSIQQLAVVDEQSRGDAVAQRLGLELLELAQRNHVHVRGCTVESQRRRRRMVADLRLLGGHGVWLHQLSPLRGPARLTSSSAIASPRECFDVLCEEAQCTYRPKPVWRPRWPCHREEQTAMSPGRASPGWNQSLCRLKPTRDGLSRKRLGVEIKASGSEHRHP